MYVIVDWHILDDNNPQTHKEKSKVFFDDISKKYADVPNVIYEICNEPNGNEVKWKEHIKPYAEEIIPIIRNNSPKSLVLVGTPNWCTMPNEAALDPLKFDNTAYTFHFYSGTHGSNFYETINYCIEKNIPIFVSECGLTQANGKGNTYFDEFTNWINFLNSKDISWIYWSFSDKEESSAILLPGYRSNLVENVDGINNSSVDGDLDSNSSTTFSFDDCLTSSGIFIREIFKRY